MRSLFCVSTFQREFKACAFRFKDKVSYQIENKLSFYVYFDPWYNKISLFELLGSQCFNIFGNSLHSPLSSILVNDFQMLLDSLSLLNLDYYLLIKNLTLSSREDLVHWNREKSLSSIMIKLVTFGNREVLLIMLFFVGQFILVGSKLLIPFTLEASSLF